MQRRRATATLTILASTLGLAACTSSTAWRIDDGLAANSVELQIGPDGSTREIEYMLPADAVPEAVEVAMDRLHPGGTTTGAEKEYDGDTVYWELTKTIDGFGVEAMFLADGTLHSSEAQVPASAIPQKVRTLVQESGWGAVNTWEHILDARGELVEYHAKTTREGRSYKLVISPKPALREVWREVEAEVELPVALED